MARELQWTQQDLKSNLQKHGLRAFQVRREAADVTEEIATVSNDLDRFVRRRIEKAEEHWQVPRRAAADALLAHRSEEEEEEADEEEYDGWWRQNEDRVWSQDEDGPPMSPEVLLGGVSEPEPEPPTGAAFGAGRW